MSLKESIIRLLLGKAEPGKVWIMPYQTKDKTGIPKPRRVSPPDGAEVSTASVPPLPGQRSLDEVLEVDAEYEAAYADYVPQFDNSNVDLPCVLTTGEYK